MTQTLDAGERFSQRDNFRATGAPTSATQTSASKFGTFAITFGIAFAILYTVFERLNWPLFTYLPVGGKLEFWSEAGAGTEAVLTVPGAVAYGASNGGRFSFLRRKKAGA